MIYFVSLGHISNNEKIMIESISPNDSLIEFLKLTLIRCMDTLKASSGSIFLLDGSGQELVLKVAINPGVKSLEGIKEKLSEGVSGFVASQRKPVLVEDIRKDSRFQNRHKFSHYHTNSFLSVPLSAGGKVIGVINITERVSGEPFRDEDLKFLLTICQHLDNAITCLKESDELKENQINELKKQLEISDKLSSLGKFASGLIHELNNPLDGIIRYTNLCLDYTDDNNIIREYLLEAKKGLNRIAMIIKSLLDLAQASSPAFSAPIDVNKAIDDCLFMLKPNLSANKIEVLRELSPSLPVVEDRGLKLAFNNLIRNASDAIGQKGGRIKISTEMKDGFIEVRFSDTGCGIPEEIRGRVFEPFFTTKQMGKGAGLGLAICYDIIRRHNGSISLENNNGAQGATFVIRLPLQAASRQKIEV
jgi:signal transduction histidine kinase